MGVVFSTKWVATIVTNVLLFAVTALITKLGVHVSAAEAAEISAVVGWAGSAVAGFAIREAGVFAPKVELLEQRVSNLEDVTHAPSDHLQSQAETAQPA